MRTSRRQIDMLHGPLLKKIVLFALPIAMSSILQQLFNAADTAVVGRFAGSDSLAAVGANGVVINLVVNLLLSMSVGTNVQMAAFAGKGDREGQSKTLHTSILFSVLCGTAIGVAGILLAPFAHEWIGTGAVESALREQAVLYLRIYLAGLPLIMLYNFASAILRSKGDTRRPLIVLILSSGLNLLLNVILVAGLHMAVAGVALATLAANAFNAAALLLLLRAEKAPYRFSLAELHMDREILGRIVRIGLPAGLQSSMSAIANVLLQAAVNSLGPAAIAGTTVALNVDILCYAALNGFVHAATTFVGQNHSAGNLRRCREITRICLLCGTLACFALSACFALLRAPFIAIFTSDAAVAAVAGTRILRASIFQGLNGTADVLSGSMRGRQRSLVPAVISILSTCGVRLLWVYTYFPAHHTYEGLVFAYPLSWAVSALAMTIAYCLTRRNET